LESLYQNLDDPGYEETQEPRSLQMRWLVKKVRKAKPDAGSLLDIGAGTGLLVREALKENIDAVGIEPSRSLVAFGRDKYEIDLLEGLFPHPDLENRRFDIITLVDIIEHVQDPIQLLKDSRDALNPEGILLLVTPDVKSFMAKIFGRKWWHYRLAHVCYFDWKSIKKAFDVAGFEVRKRFRPFWFFKLSYIAIRLEQYLPVMRRLNRVIKKIPFCNRWGRLRIPLNLYDSWGIIACKKKK
jgi:SAM-dependent methyltransferase